MCCLRCPLKLKVINTDVVQGCDVVVIMVAFYSDDPSLNPAEIYIFILLNCSKRTKESPLMTSSFFKLSTDPPKFQKWNRVSVVEFLFQKWHIWFREMPDSIWSQFCSFHSKQFWLLKWVEEGISCWNRFIRSVTSSEITNFYILVMTGCDQPQLKVSWWIIWLQRATCN